MRLGGDGSTSGARGKLSGMAEDKDFAAWSDISTRTGVIGLATRTVELDAKGRELRRAIDAGAVTPEEAVRRMSELAAEFITSG